MIRFDRLEGGLDAQRLPRAPSGQSLFWAGLNKRRQGPVRQWRHLNAGSGVSLADEAARWTHRAAITEVLKPWFASRDVTSFRVDFDAAGLTWSEFRTVHEAVEHDPDLSSGNPMFHNLLQPGIGRFPVPSYAGRFSGHDRQPPTPAPALGQHTEEVLADVAGLTGTEIAQHFHAGIVAAPDFTRRNAA